MIPVIGAADFAAYPPGIRGRSYGVEAASVNRMGLTKLLLRELDEPLSIWNSLSIFTLSFKFIASLKCRIYLLRLRPHRPRPGQHQGGDERQKDAGYAVGKLHVVSLTQTGLRRQRVQ